MRLPSPLSAILLLSTLGACNKREPAAAVTPDPTELNLQEPKLPHQGPNDGDDGIEILLLATPQLNIQGSVTLEAGDDGVEIEIMLAEGPPGVHAIHLHEKADCSDITGNSMGPRLNSQEKAHGLPKAAEHHLGNLGNVTIDDNGQAVFEATVANANLKANDPMSLLDRALVLHSKRDTGKGKAGQASPPIACAAIKHPQQGEP